MSLAYGRSISLAAVFYHISNARFIRWLILLHTSRPVTTWMDDCRQVNHLGV